MPLNAEEKKKYDREFLLGFQFITASMNKPVGLPAISDVVLDQVQPRTFNSLSSLALLLTIELLHSICKQKGILFLLRFLTLYKHL